MSKPEPIGSLVGIDIGVTCTGVAICVYGDGEAQRPITIQKWPGYHRIESKVPTKVAYKAGKATYHSWGFQCPNLGEVGPAMAVKEMFKFHLGKWFLTEEHKQGTREPFDLDDVKLWYTDFLRALYLHIIQELREKWHIDVNFTTVEYLFSVPTSWRDNDHLLEIFRDVIEAAGFKDGRIIMNLTEAEASAVSTAKFLGHEFKEGDAFIVCDAGGATSDMCALQVTEIDGDAIQLSLLDEPKDIPVGSLNIDDLFEEKAKERIDVLRNNYSNLSEALPHQITRGEFQNIKKEFGEDVTTTIPVMKFSIPGTDEKIELSLSELESMFDIQINKMCELIDHQVAFLKEDCPDVNLSSLILAGGLGSSKYLQDKMIKYYKDINVMFAPKPEDLPLSVCKGLVIDRLQHFSDQASVISIRSTSASYGILCSELCNWKKPLLGQRAYKDQLDGNKYLDNQIDWIVVKGQNSAQEKTVVRKYSRVVSPGSSPESWGFAVVRSQLEPSKLPTCFEGRGPPVICHVVSEGTIVPSRKPIVHQRWGMGKRYRFSRIDYELSATVGFGKMKFQIKIVGETGAPETLKVTWPRDDEAVGLGQRCALIKMM